MVRKAGMLLERHVASGDEGQMAHGTLATVWSLLSMSSLNASRPEGCSVGAVRASSSEARPTRKNFWTVTSDRKSTRLNSSHVEISYAVFCLKKKKKNNIDTKHYIK